MISLTNHDSRVQSQRGGNKKKSKVNPKAKPTQIPDYESTQFVRHICPNYRPRFWFEDPTDPIEKPTAFNTERANINQPS